MNFSADVSEQFVPSS